MFFQMPPPPLFGIRKRAVRVPDKASEESYNNRRRTVVAEGV